MAQVLNLQDVIIEVAVGLAMTGECDLPVDNEFGGVDLRVPGYFEGIEDPKSLVMVDGVRLTVEDHIVHVYKFEGFGVAAHATFASSFSSLSSILAVVVKEWLAN